MVELKDPEGKLKQFDDEFNLLEFIEQPEQRLYLQQMIGKYWYNDVVNALHRAQFICYKVHVVHGNIDNDKKVPLYTPLNETQLDQICQAITMAYKHNVSVINIATDDDYKYLIIKQQ